MNKSTAGEMADEAFQSAVVPVAKLLAEHITRDLFAKKLGWREFEFCFNDLESRDEMEELQIQTALLRAGVLTVDEVRAMRGLAPLGRGRMRWRSEGDDRQSGWAGRGGLQRCRVRGWAAEDRRVLNAPSRCSGMLDVGDAGLAVPVRRARVVVSSDSGTVLFTGYMATEPEAVYAGNGTKGAVYRYAFSALSDEWLLDKQAVAQGGAGLAQPAGQLLQTLTNRVDAGLFTTTGVTNGPAVGVFEPSLTASGRRMPGSLRQRVYVVSRVEWGVDAAAGGSRDPCAERWRWDPAGVRR